MCPQMLDEIHNKHLLGVDILAIQDFLFMILALQQKRLATTGLCCGSTYNLNTGQATEPFFRLFI